MLDLEQLQLIGQLVDNIGILTEGLEHSFEANDSENFVKSKRGILNAQKKIVKMIEGK